MAGIEESKELLVGVNEVALCLVTRLKDGLQLNDLTAIMQKLLTDEEFKEKLQKAYEDVGDVKDEIKDLSLGEGLELAKLQLEYIPKYMEAASK